MILSVYVDLIADDESLLGISRRECYLVGAARIDAWGIGTLTRTASIIPGLIMLKFEGEGWVGGDGWLDEV
jgi:hypothetical protein